MPKRELRLVASSTTRADWLQIQLQQRKAQRSVSGTRDGEPMPTTSKGVQEHEIVLETELPTGFYMTI